jgi:hypothetical protein
MNCRHREACYGLHHETHRGTGALRELVGRLNIKPASTIFQLVTCKDGAFFSQVGDRFVTLRFKMSGYKSKEFRYDADRYYPKPSELQLAVKLEREQQ